MSAVMSESNSSNVAELLSPGPGERLRAARLSMGYDLGRVASELHLTSGVVEALEADEYADVGARVFVRGYLRNYARIVGMPVESILRQFDEKWPEEATLNGAALRRTPRLPADGGPGSSLTSLMTWGLIGIVIVLFVLWWRGYLNGSETQEAATAVDSAEDAAAMSAAQPASVDLIQEDGTLLLPQAGGGAPVAATAGIGTPSAARTAVPQVTESAAPAPVEIVQPSQPSSVEVAPAVQPASPVNVAPATTVGDAASPSIVATTPTVVSASDGGAPVIDAGRQIVMTFSAPCWVDVRDSERKFKLFGEMPKGSRRVLGGTPPYKVVIGNARAVNITVGGKDFDLSRYAKGNVARFTLAP